MKHIVEEFGFCLERFLVIDTMPVLHITVTCYAQVANITLLPELYSGIFTVYLHLEYH